METFIKGNGTKIKDQALVSSGKLMERPMMETGLTISKKAQEGQIGKMVQITKVITRPVKGMVKALIDIQMVQFMKDVFKTTMLMVTESSPIEINHSILVSS